MSSRSRPQFEVMVCQLVARISLAKASKFSVCWGDPFEQGNVAADPRLQIDAGDFGAAEQQ
jgi:hypothetical protein